MPWAEVPRVARRAGRIPPGPTCLDEGPDFALHSITHDAELEFPGWALVETDADGNLTGRKLAVVHEGLQIADPSGREAMDLFE